MMHDVLVRACVVLAEHYEAHPLANVAREIQRGDARRRAQGKFPRLTRPEHRSTQSGLWRARVREAIFRCSEFRRAADCTPQLRDLSFRRFLQRMRNNLRRLHSLILRRLIQAANREFRGGHKEAGRALFALHAQVAKSIPEVYPA